MVVAFDAVASDVVVELELFVIAAVVEEIIRSKDVVAFVVLEFSEIVLCDVPCSDVESSASLSFGLTVVTDVGCSEGVVDTGSFSW